MTSKRILNLSAPLIAVAVIALCWAYALGWLTDSGNGAPDKTGRPEKSVTRIANGPVAPEKPYQTGRVGLPHDLLGWSTYHGNAALTGVVETVLPDRPSLLWRFQADSAVYHTPVACGEHIFFSTTKGGVFALDLEGKEVWSKHLVREIKKDGSPRMEHFDAPTACFESTVLVGSLGGTVYAFDAATGNEKWTYDVGGPILGSVNLHRSAGTRGPDRVFVIGQDDGTLHCLDLNNGEQIWQTEGIDRCDGSPAVGGNAIVFGSCAAAIHVFSVADGKLMKNIEIDEDSQIAGGVALVGDSAFSGSVSGKLIHANLRTGEIVWINEDSEYEVFTTPAVNRDWVVYGSYDGRVYALDRTTGKQKWKFETDGLPTSPVITTDKVIVGSDGTLYFLRLKTGEELWSYEVSDEITSPAIINQMIVVGSRDGTVTAFGATHSKAVGEVEQVVGIG